MQSTHSELGPVRYNAAEEAFEATVTFTTAEGSIRRPAQYAAPLNAPDALVQRGLIAAAEIQDAKNTGLKSTVCAKSDRDGADDAETGFDLFEKTRNFFDFVRNKAA
ncbi:hypothetical protein FIU97_00350 [Roseivivax sp. THAF40]|uniref:hypothetical protein n=1 Tax=unclassified Roseivivax TaxID=2639302 RepID=UPI001267E8BD|nr:MULTISPECIES: hypothetical protein [unclassified Roseivivax]QFS81287.1 hypothetical protein FIV09_00435 [Roseivivax sp. THAF197b]QFT45016.1 hypothetical protein FIU97_00350 [Roseivivax sp. THAF40]